jgi:hypothetical protein
MKRAIRKKSADRTHEVVEFMTAFARFLLAAGISRNTFARIVEFAYFQASYVDARFQNKRLNQSAVAAMTGLTRSQVRAMLRQVRAAPDSVAGRIDRIIAIWTSDAEYVTASFSPRRLRIFGSAPSFSTLVRKAGGDIPPRALLRELERQKLVSVDRPYVKLTSVGRNEIESRSLRRLSSALARVIGTTGESDGTASPLQADTMEVRYPALSGPGRILMQRRLAKILKTFVVDVEAAAAAVGIESPSRIKNAKHRISQAKLLLITRESEI